MLPGNICPVSAALTPGEICPTLIGITNLPRFVNTGNFSLTPIANCAKTRVNQHSHNRNYLKPKGNLSVCPKEARYRGKFGDACLFALNFPGQRAVMGQATGVPNFEYGALWQ
jgi:hypothetical protein